MNISSLFNFNNSIKQSSNQLVKPLVSFLFPPAAEKVAELTAAPHIVEWSQSKTRKRKSDTGETLVPTMEAMGGNEEKSQAEASFKPLTAYSHQLLYAYEMGAHYLYNQYKKNPIKSNDTVVATARQLKQLQGQQSVFS